MTARTRVAHVGPDIHGRGGMSAVLRDIARSPLAEAHDLTFIASWGGNAGRAPTPRAFAASIVRFVAGLGRLALFCLGGGRRLVHVHTAVRGSWIRKAVLVVLVRALRRPVVLQVHTGARDIEASWDAIGRRRRRFVRWAFDRADRRLAVSHDGARALHDVLGLPDVEVVRNAAPPVAPARAPAGDAADGVPVLYLGGFRDPAKGGAVLLDALPRMAGGPSGVRVLLAGPGDLPATARGWEGRGAEWLGWLDEAAKTAALARAEVVVFPSVSEGLPVALLEAMVAGRAIVATRAGGMPEVLTDGVDGVLVAPGDADALADAVRRLALDDERRRDLGACARIRVARLNQDEVYGPLTRLYAELAGEPRRAGRTARGT